MLKKLKFIFDELTKPPISPIYYVAPKGGDGKQLNSGNFFEAVNGMVAEVQDLIQKEGLEGKVTIWGTPTKSRHPNPLIAATEGVSGFGPMWVACSEEFAKKIAQLSHIQTVMLVAHNRPPKNPPKPDVL